MPFRRINEKYEGVGMNFHSFLFCQYATEFAFVHYTDMSKIKHIGLSGRDGHELLVNLTREKDRGRCPYVGPILTLLLRHTVPLTVEEAFKLMHGIPAQERTHYVWNRTRDKEARIAGYRYIAETLQDNVIGSGPPSIATVSSSSSTTVTSGCSGLPPTTQPSQLLSSRSGHSVVSDRSHTATITRSQTPEIEARGARNNVANSRGVRSPIYIPPWPCRVTDAAAAIRKEANDRHDEIHPASRVSSSRSTVKGCSTSSRSDGRDGTINGNGYEKAYSEYHISECASACSRTTSSTTCAAVRKSPGKSHDVGQSGKERVMPDVAIDTATGKKVNSTNDDGNLPSTSGLSPAISRVSPDTLAQLDTLRIPTKEKVMKWLTRIHPDAPPPEPQQVRVKRSRKRKAESDEAPDDNAKKKKF